MSQYPTMSFKGIPGKLYFWKSTKWMLKRTEACKNNLVPQSVTAGDYQRAVFKIQGRPSRNIHWDESLNFEVFQQVGFIKPDDDVFMFLLDHTDYLKNKSHPQQILKVLHKDFGVVFIYVPVSREMDGLNFVGSFEEAGGGEEEGDDADDEQQS